MGCFWMGYIISHADYILLVTWKCGYQKAIAHIASEALLGPWSVSTPYYHSNMSILGDRMTQKAFFSHDVNSCKHS